MGVFLKLKQGVEWRIIPLSSLSVEIITLLLAHSNREVNGLVFSATFPKGKL